MGCSVQQNNAFNSASYGLSWYFIKEPPLESQGGGFGVFFYKTNIPVLCLAKTHILASTMCAKYILAPSMENN